MTDADDIKSKLSAVIAALDPGAHGVAIAHLNDALEAFEAENGGRATTYALHDQVVEGKVRAIGHLRQIK
ncbi:hypothetical protein [Tateyamaria sp. SN6-1]|uniref:hypothetical protein n=1 Tax=Tateyamaria sp. SN6-1 TaxID=3092148 RepID=UPI0039F4FF93